MSHDAPLDPHATPDGSAPAQHAAHEPSHMKVYVRTILTLSVATAVEFAISFWMQGKSQSLFTTGIVVLVAVAFFKASLVARNFMHLKYDPRLLAFLIVLPLILAAPIIFLVGFDVKNGPAW